MCPLPAVAADAALTETNLRHIFSDPFIDTWSAFLSPQKNTAFSSVGQEGLVSSSIPRAVEPNSFSIKDSALRELFLTFITIKKHQISCYTDIG